MPWMRIEKMTNWRTVGNEKLESVMRERRNLQAKGDGKGRQKMEMKRESVMERVDGGDMHPEQDCVCRLWAIDANSVNSLLNEEKVIF